MGIAAAVIDDLLERFPFACRTHIDIGAGDGSRRCIGDCSLTDIDRELVTHDFTNIDEAYDGPGSDDYIAREAWQTTLLPERADVVYSAHALQHAPLRRTLQEWRRLLKPGGLLWLAVPNYTWLAKELVDAPKNEGARHIERLTVRNGFTAWTLTRALLDAGFADIIVTETEVIECHGMSELRAVAHKPTKTLAQTAHDAFQSAGLTIT